MKSYSGSTVVSVFVVAVRSISRANTNGLVATYYCKEIEMKYYTDKRHSHTHSRSQFWKRIQWQLKQQLHTIAQNWNSWTKCIWNEFCICTSPSNIPPSYADFHSIFLFCWLHRLFCAENFIRFVFKEIFHIFRCSCWLKCHTTHRMNYCFFELFNFSCRRYPHHTHTHTHTWSLVAIIIVFLISHLSFLLCAYRICGYPYTHTHILRAVVFNSSFHSIAIVE